MCAVAIQMSPIQAQSLLEGVTIHQMGGLGYYDPTMTASDGGFSPLTLNVDLAPGFCQKVVPNLFLADAVLRANTPSPASLEIIKKNFTLAPDQDAMARGNGFVVPPPIQSENPKNLDWVSENGRRLRVTQLWRPSQGIGAESTKTTVDVEEHVPHSLSYRGQTAIMTISAHVDTKGQRRVVFHGHELSALLANKRIAFTDNLAVFALMTSAIFGELPERPVDQEQLRRSLSVYNVTPRRGKHPKTNRRNPLLDNLRTRGRASLSEIAPDQISFLGSGQSFVAEFTFVRRDLILMACVRKYNEEDFSKGNDLSLSLTYFGSSDITAGIQGKPLKELDNALQSAFDQSNE